jgi:uncharacterized damage-inducible protein DinB
MNANPITITIGKQKEFFQRSLSCFTEEDADYRPQPGMLSVSGHIHHTTASIELMMSGILREFPRFGERRYASRRPGATWKEWGMDWAYSANHDTVRADWSLASALRAFDETMDIVSTIFAELTPDEMRQPLGDNPMKLPSAFAVLYFGIFDHTAHHRGALSQYARLLGKEPRIPYFDMAEALHEATLND